MQILNYYLRYKKILNAFFVALLIAPLVYGSQISFSNEFELHENIRIKSQDNFFVDPSLNDKDKLYNAIDYPTSQAFHLFSHGKPGHLYINNTWKNSAEIVNWLRINFDLKTYENINIYGCSFAKNKVGKEAVQFIENALNLPVSASNNITGLNGDWVLEVGSSNNNIKVGNYLGNLQFNTCADVGVAITTNVGSTGSCTASGDGSITVVGYNGTLPFEYSIDGGAFQTSEVFINLSPGIRTATVRDANGNTCSVDVDVAAGSGPITGSTGCAITVAGTTNTLRDYEINFTNDATVTGGNGTTVAAISGDVSLPDGSDAGFDYTIDAVITGGPGGGTNINFPNTSTLNNSFHEPNSPSVDVGGNVIQFQIIGQRNNAAEVYRDLSTQLKVDVNLDNGGCFENINFIIGDIDATFINNCNSEPNDYDCRTSYIDRVRVISGAGTNTYSSAGSNVTTMGDIGLSIYPDANGNGYPDTNFDTRVASTDPTGYYVVNNNTIPLSSLTYVYDDPGYGLDVDTDRLHDFDAFNQFHTIGGPITFSQTEHNFCETASATLSACPGLTNVTWFNNTDTQVGTGADFVATSTTAGLQDASESFYYTGTTADGCEIKACPALLTTSPVGIAAPAISIVDNTCTPEAPGSISIDTPCGAGSSIQYSADGGVTWSSTAPAYTENSITVRARCADDANNECFSSATTDVVSAPQNCCPVENCINQFGEFTIIKNRP